MSSLAVQFATAFALSSPERRLVVIRARPAALPVFCCLGADGDDLPKPPLTTSDGKPPKPWRHDSKQWQSDPEEEPWRRDPKQWKKKRTSREKVTETSRKVSKAYSDAKENSLLTEWPVICMLIALFWPWMVGWGLGRYAGPGAASFVHASALLANLQVACSRLLLAALCGATIGVERARTVFSVTPILDRPAGMRTMTLVSSGAAIYVLACTFSPHLSLRANPTRVAAQVCTGVGFIGAGVIAKGGRNDPARGVTTACAVWVSAALGILAATGLNMLALWATGLSVSILRISSLYQTVQRSQDVDRSAAEMDGED